MDGIVNMNRLIKKISSFDRSTFNQNQLNKIDQAIKDGLDINQYLLPEIDASKMSVIFEGLRQGIDVSLYDDWKKFNKEQMAQILDGLIYNIQPTLYINPDFSSGQMFYIKEAIMKGYPLHLFLNKEISEEKMESIMNKLDNLEDTVDKHDYSSRDKALVYLNGKFCSGKTHSDCLNKILKSNEREEVESKFYRPNQEQINQVINQQDQMFFANIVNDPYDFEDYDGTNNYNAIYIIPDSHLLVGITLEEAAQILKNSEKYGHYNIFKDSDSYIDYHIAERIFPLLAKLKSKKQHIYSTKIQNRR